MSARRVVSMLLLAMMGVTASGRAAHAGDPCPIGVTVIDLGLPPWAEPTLQDSVKAGDRFLAALIEFGKAQDCSEVAVKRATATELPVEVVDGATGSLAVADVKATLTDKKRAFRCAAAHKELGYLRSTRAESGTILYYRGRRRILMVMPGWATICVDTKVADKAPAKEAARAWKRVTARMVKDRHDNP